MLGLVWLGRREGWPPRVPRGPTLAGGALCLVGVAISRWRGK
jgi:hypothetical protein